MTAAVRGQAKAQYNLGMLYAEGDGVPQDYIKARQWWEKAAAQGDEVAQYNLGVLYRDGLGVPQDDVKAYMCLNLGAAHMTGDEQKRAAENRDEVA